MKTLKPCEVRGSFAVLKALRGKEGVGVAKLQITEKGELLTILENGKEINAGLLPTSSIDGEFKVLKATVLENSGVLKTIQEQTLPLLTAKVDTHETRLIALEEGGGGGDLTPILNRVALVETDVQTLQEQVADHNSRLLILESNTTPDLSNLEVRVSNVERRVTIAVVTPTENNN